ncbi:MAG: non-canonical purine NTP pyrophosphatase [Saprospiraceae bacterium]
MTQLVFATGNPHKVKEVNEMLIDGSFKIISLNDIGCYEDIPETSPTIEANALQKARYVFEKYGHDCFSEDTGLEIMALNGEPGVLTARYAGDERDNDANMRLVLNQKNCCQADALPDRVDRPCCAIQNTSSEYRRWPYRRKIGGKVVLLHYFSASWIYDITFAEMDATEKNKISHRGKGGSQAGGVFGKKTLTA